MALERFTETYKPDIATYKNFVSSRKITESEILILKNSNSKLQESIKKFLEDNPQYQLEGKIVYRVPISRYDWKNANGRVYSKKLWENVIKSQKEAYEGGIGLADHPEDDQEGKFKETAVVWLSLGLNESYNVEEKIVWGDCIFVGPHGRLAEEIMEAGGRVGFSSSGFGELEESDKSQVRWDTYMLERVSDIVLNPSQNVYGKKENIHKESSAKTENSIKENKETIPMKEATTPEIGKFSKIEERKIREDIQKYFELAKSVPNPALRLKELEDIQESFLEVQSLFNGDKAEPFYQELTKAISETTEEIDVAIEEHIRVKETFGVAGTEELKEGIVKLATDLEFNERTVDEWKKMAEGFQDTNKKLRAINASLPTITAYKEALNKQKELKAVFTEKEQELLGVIEALQGKIEKHQASQKKLVTELTSISRTNETLSEENAKIKSIAISLKKKLSEAREIEVSRLEALQEQRLQETTVNFQPKKTSHNYFDGFSEKEEIQKYWKDIYKRHGRDILPYKESILACKVLKEAMVLYNKFFSELGSASSRKLTEALPESERRSLLESQNNIKIASHKPLELRKPKTWI